MVMYVLHIMCKGTDIWGWFIQNMEGWCWWVEGWGPKQTSRPCAKLFACNYPLKHLKVRPQKTRPCEIYHFPTLTYAQPTLRLGGASFSRTPKLQCNAVLLSMLGAHWQWPPITISLTPTIINPNNLPIFNICPRILVVFVNNSGWICMWPNWGGKLPSLEVLSGQVSPFHLLLFPVHQYVGIYMDSQ